MANMRPPKVPEKIVPVLTMEQLKALLASCEGQSFEARRDLALLRVYMTTGSRRNEIADLRYSKDHMENDLDLDVGIARVHGKGGHDRIIPLDPRTIKALDRYVRARAQHSYTALPWLWLGQKGRLTHDGIRQALENRAKAAGIEKFHLHMMRHSFAHHWLSQGGQESDLMRLVGWRSPQMLRRYAASSAQDRALAASRRIGLGATL